MSQVSAQKNNTMLIKWAINILIPLVILFMPTNETFTVGMKVFLVITVWAILSFIFETLPTTTTSICLMFGYAFFNVAPLATVLSSWAGSTPWMVFGSLVLVNVVQRTTLMRRIAYWLLIKTGGTYAGIIYALITLCVISNILVGSTLMLIAILTLAYGITQALELGKSKASAGIMMATAMCFLDAGNFIFTPNGFGVLMGICSTITPLEISYLNFFIQNAVFVPLVYILGFIIIKIMKPEKSIDGKQYFIEQYNALPKITKEEKKLTGVLIGLLVYLFTITWHGYDMMYGFLIAAFILYFPGFKIGTPQDVAKADFGVLIFVTACMSIGSAASYVGIGPVFSSLVLPVLANAGSYAFIVITWVIIVAGNFLMTPGAEFAVFGPPLTQICVDLGINPMPMLYAFYQGTNNLLFPYESTLALISFGYGNVHMSDFIKCWGMKMIVCAIYLCALGIPYWMLIGIL